ncbi:MAG: N-acetylmuramidase domain-containing protein [Chitinophagaceae bacterium]
MEVKNTLINTTLALSKISSGQNTGYSYLYDQLNRLLGTRQHTINGSSWNHNSYNAAYEEKATYDANGNIKTYVRKGANVTGMPLAMDNLKYFYYYIKTNNQRGEYDPTQLLPSDVKKLSNQLAHVEDTDPSSNYTVDIDNQSLSNYDYDNIGNLIKDNAEGITNINWTVYGKIKQITKSNGITINYGYDAAGNRVVKEVTGAPGGYNRQFYIRDAQGNVLSIYKDQSDYVNWQEQHLYGSSRLGVWNYGKAKPGVPPSVVYDSSMVGSVNYELSNHLGNVLATISDKKIGATVNNTSVDHYQAEVISQQDYYPFGMVMPGRGYEVSYTKGYRYGFNGMEKDDEVKGEGNSLDFGARIFDNRLGRFLSIDPLAGKNPMLSPYAFAANNPIALIDRNGEEPTPAAYKKAAEKLGVTVAQIRAVYKSEVGPDAFFDGKAKILYERHYFSDLTNGKFDKDHPKISNPTAGAGGTYRDQYIKLEAAIALDEDAAFQSVSYGGFQIMGRNYKAAGFKSPKEMYEALTSDDEDKHLEAFTNYLLNDKATNPKKGVTMTKLEALRKKNWTQFAKGYNGPAQKGYDTKMEKNYESLKDNELKGLEEEVVKKVDK